MFAAVFLLCIFQGCSANKGKATRAYIQAYMQASADLAAQLRELPPINPPEISTVQGSRPRKSKAETAAERRRFADAMDKYYNDFVDRGHLLEDLYGRTLNQISALNAAGVEPAAVATVTAHERTIGRHREIYVELGHLVMLERQRKGDDSLGGLVKDIVGQFASQPASLSDPTGTAQMVEAAKGFAKFVSRGQADADAVKAQGVKVADAVDQYRRDLITYQTAFAQLRTTVQSDYPDRDWSFLRAKPN